MHFVELNINRLDQTQTQKTHIIYNFNNKKNTYSDMT